MNWKDILKRDWVKEEQDIIAVAEGLGYVRVEGDKVIIEPKWMMEDNDGFDVPLDVNGGIYFKLSEIDELSIYFYDGEKLNLERGYNTHIKSHIDLMKAAKTLGMWEKSNLPMWDEERFEP